MLSVTVHTLSKTCPKSENPTQMTMHVKRYPWRRLWPRTLDDLSANPAGLVRFPLRAQPAPSRFLLRVKSIINSMTTQTQAHVYMYPFKHLRVRSANRPAGHIRSPVTLLIADAAKANTLPFLWAALCAGDLVNSWNMRVGALPQLFYRNDPSAVHGMTQFVSKRVRWCKNKQTHEHPRTHARETVGWIFITPTLLANHTRRVCAVSVYILYNQVKVCRLLH